MYTFELPSKPSDWKSFTVDQLRAKIQNDTALTTRQYLAIKERIRELEPTRAPDLSAIGGD